MARAIGTPLRIDSHTLSGEVGRFARVLVDLDLSSRLPESIILQRKEGDFNVKVNYENLPAFCSSCNGIGHVASKCRRLASIPPAPHQPVKKTSIVKGKQAAPPVFTVVAPEGHHASSSRGTSNVATSNAFAVLAEKQTAPPAAASETTPAPNASPLQGTQAPAPPPPPPPANVPIASSALDEKQLSSQDGSPAQTASGKKSWADIAEEESEDSDTATPAADTHLVPIPRIAPPDYFQDTGNFDDKADYFYPLPKILSPITEVYENSDGSPQSGDNDSSWGYASDDSYEPDSFSQSTCLKSVEHCDDEEWEPVRKKEWKRGRHRKGPTVADETHSSRKGKTVGVAEETRSSRKGKTAGVAVGTRSSSRKKSIIARDFPHQH